MVPSGIEPATYRFGAYCLNQYATAPPIENYSSSKYLKASPEKSQILSCDAVVANERYIVRIT